MSAFPVIVRAGRDYWSPPVAGDSLLPVDMLTNPARWVGAFWTCPAPVVKPRGIELDFRGTPDGNNAIIGTILNFVAGHTYTFTATVNLPAGSPDWALTLFFKHAEWRKATGFDVTATFVWTCPSDQAVFIGIETKDSRPLVVDIGVFDHDDEGVQWHPRDLDNCDVALPVSITHGRSGTDTQPDAPSCTFRYLGSQAPTTLGDSIEVEVAGAPGATWTDPNVLWTDPSVSWLGTRGRSLRFRGFVTSVRAVEVLGVVAAWDIEATGEQARLGRIPVDITRPQETDVERVQAIAAAAGVPVQIVGDPGVTLVADAIERDALSALHEVCASSGGLVWQQRDGTITYGTMYRFREMPEWRVYCDLVLDGIEWTHNTNAVVNHIVVTYGPESGQTQDTYRDDESIAKWGYRHADIGTMLADQSNAAVLAGLVLARRRQPRWVMPGVVALRNEATAAQWAQIANLDFGHTALIDVETVPTPTPGQITSWTVEGWVETWEPEGRRVQLALSEYRLGVPIPWSLADDETWDHWRSNASWLTAMVEV